MNNAGTIASVAGTIAMVAAVLPPPAQVVAAAAGAVAVVAGAIDTVKTCAGGDAAGCAMGVAGMVPGVRQAKNAVRGAGAIKNAAKTVTKKASETCETPNSFVPGTPVLMADGTGKPIEDVELGDSVLAVDPDTGVSGARPVTELITGDGAKHLVDVIIDADGDGKGDDQVTATDTHPFWVDREQAWLTAGELEAGASLLTPEGARVTVVGTEDHWVTARVHNLTVDDLHTYFVRTAVADVLVHNCGGAIKGMLNRWKESKNINRQQQDGHILGTQSHTNRIKPNPQTGKVKSTSIWSGGQRWARIHTRLTWTFGRPGNAGERLLGFPWRTGTMNGRAQNRVRVTQNTRGQIHGTPWGRPGWSPWWRKLF